MLSVAELIEWALICCIAFSAIGTFVCWVYVFFKLFPRVEAVADKWELSGAPKGEENLRTAFLMAMIVTVIFLGFVLVLWLWKA